MLNCLLHIPVSANLRRKSDPDHRTSISKRKHQKESTAMSLTSSTSFEVAKAAATSSRSLAVLSADARNAALTAIHQALADAKATILTANATDLHLASKAALNGELSQSVLKRLDLCRKGKWEEMLQGILDVRDLDDPGKNYSHGT